MSSAKNWHWAATLLFWLALGVTAHPAYGQRRDPDPHDVEAGSARYTSICASCHGIDGDQVRGVAFGHGKFRRATTDEELIGIIQNGIPGTGMPANRMSAAAAGAVVSYLRAIAADNTRNTSKNGEPARGKAAFAKNGCSGCHRIGQEGSRLGPDLSDIATYRRSVEVERSILDPSAEIAPQNRFVTVIAKDGTKVTGRLLNQDAFRVLLMDSSERLRSFDRQTVTVTIEDKLTTMPSFKGKVGDQELSDLVTYLMQQKGTPLK
jgi:cytochrome c oxidase cbb3-type subunit III